MSHESSYGYFDPWSSSIWLDMETVATYPESRLFPLLVITALLGSHQDDHLRYVAGLKSAPDIAFVTSWFTAYTHEARHFHDAILTPYGCAQARSFIGLGLIAKLLMAEVSRSKAVYIPIGAWSRNFTQLQRAFPDLGAPSSVLSELVKLLDEILKDIRVLTVGPGNHPGEVDAAAIMETSALAAQTGMVGQLFGQAAIEPFLHEALSVPGGPRYFSAFNFISAAMGRPLRRDAIQLILLASLCGRVDRTARAVDYPPYLLSALLALLAPFSKGDRYADLAPMVDSYLRHQNGHTLRESLLRTDKENRAFGRLLRRTLGKVERALGSILPSARIVLAYYEAFCDIHKATADIVANDVGWYCSDAYSLQARIRLPEPLLLIYAAGGLPIAKAHERYFSLMSSTRQGDHDQGDLIVQVASPKWAQHEHHYGLWHVHGRYMQLLKFLLAGPRSSRVASEATRSTPATEQDFAAVLKALGVKVFTIAGESQAYFYPGEEASWRAGIAEIVDRVHPAYPGVLTPGEIKRRERAALDFIRQTRHRRELWHQPCKPQG